MSLKERITEDMKSAMRAKDAARLLTIRGLLAALKQREVDERIELDDAAVVAIVDKLVKQRKDSIQQFTAGGRQDLVDKESAELKVLEGYLPDAARRRRDRRRSRGARAPRPAPRARPTWARSWRRRKRSSPAGPTWARSPRRSRPRSRADAPRSGTR